MIPLILYLLAPIIDSVLASESEVYFERNKINYLTHSNQSFQILAFSPDPPRFILDERGYLTYAGEGDFGLLLIDRLFNNFRLDLEIVIPEEPFTYANSGIFFRSKDPRRVDYPEIPATIIELANKRTPGFIANWSSYEVQLLAGAIPDENATSKQNGAFYGVPEGIAAGQQIHQEFRFNPGQTYQVRLEVIEQQFKVSMKWSAQSDYLLVSTMTNQDFMRSFNPGYIGLQSYYSNGNTVKALRFNKIVIQKIP